MDIGFQSSSCLSMQTFNCFTKEETNHRVHLSKEKTIFPSLIVINSHTMSTMNILITCPEVFLVRVLLDRSDRRKKEKRRWMNRYDSV